MEVEIPLVEFGCALASCTGFCPLSKPSLVKAVWMLEMFLVC